VVRQIVASIITSAGNAQKRDCCPELLAPPACQSQQRRLWICL